MKNTIGSRNNINWSFLTGLAKIGLTIVISFLAVYGLVQAGSLTPLSDPASTMYTLDDIYNRLDTNATANEGDHNFSISGSPTGSMRTLTEIYEAIPTILADTVKLGTSYLGVDGSLIPNGGTATEADLFTGASAHLNGDWDLDTGTLTLACDTTTFDGAANLVPDSYDGDGDGANRWCIDNSSTATAADIRVGTTAWVNGVAVNGQLNPDVDLTSMYGGGGLGYGGESQDDGGIDDYVGGTGVAEGRYEGNWLTCDSENNWCNTGLESASSQDLNTGLIWSRGCSGIGCADFSQGSLKEDLTRYSWDNTHGNNGGLTSSELCASGTHGETGWRLPHQKQLMQAYINGSFANIADISVWMGSMWSATTVSWNTDYAWQVHLSHGYTRPRFKNTPSDDTNHSYIICVR